MFYVTQDVQHRFELDLNLKVFRNLNMDHSNKGYVKIYARTVCKKISWQETYLKKNNLSALKLDKIKHRLENCLHLFFSQGKMICVFRLITKTNGCTKQKLINSMNYLNCNREITFDENLPLKKYNYRHVIKSTTALPL